MKKSLIALATLSAMTMGVSATEVQLFGQVDEFIAFNNTQGTYDTAIKSGGASASHFGLKGVEDLGNGMQAFFNLDQAFLADTGSVTFGSNGMAFSREANVGLRGPFGQISFGRQYTPHFLTFAIYDPTELSLGSSFSGFFFPGPNAVTGDAGDLVRIDNSIQYVLPTPFGLTNFFFVSLGEHAKPNGGTSSTRGNLYNYAAKLDYGKFSGMISYAWEKYAAGFPGSERAGDAYTVKWLNTSFTYDFGVTKPVLQVLKKWGSPAHGSNSFWMAQIGTSTPIFGGKWMISGTYLKNETQKHANAWGVGTKFNYPLSKRTKLYAGVQAIFNGSHSGYQPEAGPDSSMHFNLDVTNLFNGNYYGVPNSVLGKNVQTYFLGINHTF